MLHAGAACSTPAGEKSSASPSRRAHARFVPRPTHPTSMRRAAAGAPFGRATATPDAWCRVEIGSRRALSGARNVPAWVPSARGDPRRTGCRRSLARRRSRCSASRATRLVGRSPRAQSTTWALSRRAVLNRDGRRCTVPGCNHTRPPSSRVFWRLRRRTQPSAEQKLDETRSAKDLSKCRGGR